jgi:hypothetical protein
MTILKSIFNRIICISFPHLLQVEKGERLKKLEEKILKKSGLWERYQQQYEQKQVLDEQQKELSKELNSDEGFLKMIFGNAGEEEEKSGPNEEANDSASDSNKEQKKQKRTSISKKKTITRRSRRTQET